MATSAEQAAIANAVSSGMKAVTLGELFEVALPPRNFLLGPWLLAESINLIHARRGTGKTLFAMQTAIAAATGGKFGPWSAPKPVRVLYIDGEMPVQSIRERYRDLMSETARELLFSNIRIMSASLRRQSLPDLSREENHQHYEEEVEKADLIIVDNLSCLAQGKGNENESESWMAIQNWAISLRARGKTIIFIHHSGKAGAQRGTSKREDIADVIINLKSTFSEHDCSQGAEFEVCFEKFREIGNDISPLILTLRNAKDGRSEWSSRPARKADWRKIRELKAQGLSQSEIAKELNVDKSTISRRLMKMT